MVKVYVTGYGIVSALGIGAPPTLEALRNRRSGIGPIRWLKTIHSHLPCAEVAFSTEQLREITGIPAGTITTRTALMGILALKEALETSGWSKGASLPPVLISGTTVGGMENTEAFFLDFIENNSRNEYILAHDCGVCTQMIADYFGAIDTLSTISTACSSAANAMVMAADMIRTGRTSMAVAGGSECLSKFHLNGFHTLRILDKDPCRPFDATRAGLNLGEGAAYLVLESEDSVKARGATPICLLSGYGNACDAYHQTASSPEGDGAVLSMKKALQDAALRPEDIGYINAHGTGTPNNDISEGLALMRVFGTESVPPVSSTKSYTGHTTSAAGSVEAVISILALQHNFLPVNLNFKHPMQELSFCPITDENPIRPLKHVMTNSFGFGGNDTTTLFSKI
ncbi:MAG: beta-ketoacyl-[acyl-carrier-protein] synthase family protein [Bacteroidales bacterium]|jgi:3-oxoacyl-[acyl-carrier-protein] synthase II|nr:beta-ketoacyl-[acyl-carrier-protein] synthase family protein [Bacteroidales bacterium]NLK79653.1 beta-ketoacyl-[acyl-carrier-protein] synthase family protein [Bacteroidales bacterium]HKM30554.1 beta-ketoacyl-[acyl-carrier-protein] synthase family protein [Bacteroidales bacterium]HPX78921.1 beta-ketoacyl-[acyl-carrier-protein] synthase family protein [Bacteroidales bacterium]